MATHSSVLAWRIPGTGEPGGLLSMGSHRVDKTEVTQQQQQQFGVNLHKQLNGVHNHTALEDSALENSDKLALKLQVSFKDTGKKREREKR